MEFLTYLDDENNSHFQIIFVDNRPFNTSILTWMSNRIIIDIEIENGIVMIKKHFLSPFELCEVFNIRKVKII